MEEMKVLCVDEVFSRIGQGRRLEPVGQKMQRVKNCGGVTALFKDERGNLRAAVFCDTFLDERTGDYIYIRPVKLFHPPLKINGKDTVTKWIRF